MWVAGTIVRARANLSTASATIRRPASRGRSYEMPNIKQQEKRVRTAARERLENLRYRSTVKTLTRRLESAVEDGDAERIAEEHRSLVRWIDKAVSRGALHKNTAARKKASASRLASRSAS
jgi:small subunit ribosomal protein S20